MLSLTTGQLHDLLVSFTNDYHGWNIRAIRLCDDVIAISCVDVMGMYHRVQYSVKTSVEFVKTEE